MYVAVFFTHNICIILRHEDLKKIANIFLPVEDISRHAALFTKLHKETRTALFTCQNKLVHT